MTVLQCMGHYAKEHSTTWVKDVVHVLADVHADMVYVQVHVFSSEVDAGQDGESIRRGKWEVQVLAA